jgi:NTE family protein
LLVGTSIGAANAAFVALRGLTTETLDALEQTWHAAAAADLLPANYLWLTVRTLFNRQGEAVEDRVRTFFAQQGLDPGLRFGQLTGPRLILVAADLKAGCAVLHGENPEASVLSGVLASSALPPWIRPLDREEGLMVDGGLVSNLPIEPALTQGATEIVALDISDPRPTGPLAGGVGPFLYQIRTTLEERQVYLEKKVAALQGVPVYHVRLRPKEPLPLWDFPRALAQFERGYHLMRRYLDEHPELLAPSAEARGCRLWRRKDAQPARPNGPASG